MQGDIPDDHCIKTSKEHGKGLQCLLETDHASPCKFTPDKGISRSTAQDL